MKPREKKHNKKNADMQMSKRGEQSNKNENNVPRFRF